MSSQYRDLNALTPTNKATVTGVESVYQSLDNLFGTMKGQRVFNPEYGADLETLLFEPLNEDTAFLIFKTITDSIRQYEPRVNVLYGKSEVVPNYNLSSYDVTLYFNLRGIEEEEFEYLDSIKKF